MTSFLKLFISATRVLCISLLTLVLLPACSKKNSSSLTKPTPLAETALAFPEAEGFGRETTGGRGGKVYFVTTTQDGTQEGTLRYAVNQAGPRFILFKVSGIIQLNSTLTIKNGDVTIAGQTAPGEGICLSKNTLTIDADNVIIRHLRCRLGNDPLVENDAMNARDHSNIIIDHCSMSWSVDETGSFYDNKNFTLQWCILSESLYNAGHVKGAHGYCGIWGGQKASFHHNLLAHHTSRMPRFCGSRYTGKPDLEIVDFRNNVLYNWGSINSSYGNEGGNVNMVNNYYKAGPATPGSSTTSSTSNKRNRILNYTSFYHSSDAAVYPDTLFGGKFFIDGNYVYGFPDVSSDNWTKGVQKDSYYRSAQLITAAKQTTAFPSGNIRTQTAADAFSSVLDSAGAILPKRDVIDTRITGETRTGTATFGDSYGAGTGIIDTPAGVGGWPSYNSTSAPLDTDKDGMPDSWETSKGLDPNSYNANGRDLSTGYDNIEVYINSIK